MTAQEILAGWRLDAELVTLSACQTALGAYQGGEGFVGFSQALLRAGARSPVSGMMHSGFLLVFMLVAAPLARFVPLAALAGILVVVCWNMAEKAEFVRLLRDWRSGSRH